MLRGLVREYIDARRGILEIYQVGHAGLLSEPVAGKFVFVMAENPGVGLGVKENFREGGRGVKGSNKNLMLVIFMYVSMCMSLAEIFFRGEVRGIGRVVIRRKSGSRNLESVGDAK